MRAAIPGDEAVRRGAFALMAALAATGLVTPPIALGFGLLLALTVGNPFPAAGRKVSKILLQASVVALGFGMNIGAVWKAGCTGFWFTTATVLGTIAAGWAVGRLLAVERETSLLISSGTGICGGSAIAAVGGVLNADSRAMSVSLCTVFVLNAIALFLFPPLGRALGMDQQQFGVWAAIAIHDTSSVVGAAARYGDEALNVATTVKLARALWIVPVALGTAFLSRRKASMSSFPWFVLFFVGAAAVVTALPCGAPVYMVLRSAGKLGLTLTLFLIGAGLSRDAVKAVGIRPMVQGVILWCVVSLAGLAAVRAIVP